MYAIILNEFCWYTGRNSMCFNYRLVNHRGQLKAWFYPRVTGHGPTGHVLHDATLYSLSTCTVCAGNYNPCHDCTFCYIHVCPMLCNNHLLKLLNVHVHDYILYNVEHCMQVFQDPCTSVTTFVHYLSLNNIADYSQWRGLSHSSHFHWKCDLTLVYLNTNQCQILLPLSLHFFTILHACLESSGSDAYSMTVYTCTCSSNL